MQRLGLLALSHAKKPAVRRAHIAAGPAMGLVERRAGMRVVGRVGPAAVRLDIAVVRRVAR
ncbi:hypothetical protein GCM10009741_20430 [Kribbella lupini]|uniref:Uncharacterized protein n=1 Tax=Kribbella lupini TaxID=291602 RepID=A0ABP4LAK7_9ACTN